MNELGIWQTVLTFFGLDLWCSSERFLRCRFHFMWQPRWHQSRDLHFLPRQVSDSYLRAAIRWIGYEPLPHTLQASFPPLPDSLINARLMQLFLRIRKKGQERRNKQSSADVIWLRNWLGRTSYMLGVYLFSYGTTLVITYKKALLMLLTTQKLLFALFIYLFIYCRLFISSELVLLEILPELVTLKDKLKAQVTNLSRMHISNNIKLVIIK